MFGKKKISKEEINAKAMLIARVITDLIILSAESIEKNRGADSVEDYDYDAFHKGLLKIEEKYASDSINVRKLYLDLLTTDWGKEYLTEGLMLYFDRKGE